MSEILEQIFAQNMSVSGNDVFFGDDGNFSVYSDSLSPELEAKVAAEIMRRWNKCGLIERYEAEEAEAIPPKPEPTPPPPLRAVQGQSSVPEWIEFTDRFGAVIVLRVRDIVCVRKSTDGLFNLDSTLMGIFDITESEYDRLKAILTH